MLVYNTTYHVETSEEKNFLIWVSEYLIPAIKKEDCLKNPRFLRILSHQEEGGCSFSLQWEIEDSATLHKWHMTSGQSYNQQLSAIFKDKVVGIPTLMEIVE